MGEAKRRKLSLPMQQLRPCGDCTACCSAMLVGELDKPAMTACPRVSPIGCSMYEERPASCRAFDCAWRFSPPWLAESDRPDRTGVVLYANPVFQAITGHAVRPGSTREPAAVELFARMDARGVSFVVIEGVQVEEVHAPPESGGGAPPLVARVKSMFQPEV